MSLLKLSSKPIAKRKPRRVYKIKSTLDTYFVAKAEHESKQKSAANSEMEDDSDLNHGPY